MSEDARPPAEPFAQEIASSAPLVAENDDAVEPSGPTQPPLADPAEPASDAADAEVSTGDGSSTPDQGPEETTPPGPDDDREDAVPAPPVAPEATLDSVATSLRMMIAEMAILEKRLQRMNQTVAAIHPRLEETATSVKRHANEHSSMSSAVDALAGSISQRLSALEAEVANIRPDAAFAEGVRAALAEERDRSADGARQLVEGIAEAVTGRLAETESRVERLAEVVDGLRDVFDGTLDAAIGPIDQRVRDVVEELGVARERAEGERVGARIDSVSASVDALAEIVRSVQEKTSTLPEDRGIVERGLREFAEAFNEHMSSLQRSVTTSVGEHLSRRLGVEAESYAALRSTVESLRDGVPAELEALLGGRLAAIPREVSEALRETLERSAAAIQSELSAGRALHRVELAQAVDTISSRIAGLEETVSTARAVSEREIAQLRAAIETTINGSRQAIEASVDAFAGTVHEELTASHARLMEVNARAAGEMEQRVQLAVDALRSSEAETTAQLRADLGATTQAVESVIRMAAEQVRRQADAITEISTRVTTLAERIDAMAQRRGFQKLVESEDRLLSEQATFLERLEASRGALVADVDRLNERLTSFETELDSSIRGVRTETISDLERIRVGLRETVAELTRDVVSTIQALREHVDRLAGPRSDIQAVAGEVEATGYALRGEVKSLSSDLTDLRGALEQQMKELDEDVRDRLADVERRLVESLAQEIDRRLETLIRLIEAGLPQVENLLRMAGPPQLPQRGDE